MKTSDSENLPPEKRSSAHPLVALLRENLWWWLTPTLLLFALFAGFLLFGGSGVSPFIYSAP